MRLANQCTAFGSQLRRPLTRSRRSRALARPPPATATSGCSAATACCARIQGATFEHLLEGERADLIFTDPPYNVPIDGHVCGLGRIRHREFAMGVGEMSRQAFTEFLRLTLGHAAACCRDGAIAFVCMDWRHFGELLAAGETMFSELKNLCVWNKSNSAPPPRRPRRDRIGDGHSRPHV